MLLRYIGFIHIIEIKINIILSNDKTFSRMMHYLRTLNINVSLTYFSTPLLIGITATMIIGFLMMVCCCCCLCPSMFLCGCKQFFNCSCCCPSRMNCCCCRVYSRAGTSDGYYVWNKYSFLKRILIHMKILLIQD